MSEQLYGADSPVTAHLKAAVLAGTTDSSSWTGSLVGTESNIFADFAEYLRPRTVVGRFGVDGIPALRRVPFRTRLVNQTGAGAGYWVGEAQGKPVTAFDFGDTNLEPKKVASITVVSDELIRDSSPSAEALLRDQLVEANRARMDADFVDPAITATSARPASITNGITLTAATGTTLADLEADVGAVLEAFAEADNDPTTGVWIMSPRLASRIGLMRNDLGQLQYPNLSMRGGTFEGFPVITSNHVATVGSPYATNIYLVNASDIYVADEGDFMVDMSREASLEMADNPTGSGGTGSPLAPVAAQLVSLWQTNLVGLRAERTINWARRRDVGVAGISGAAYGTA